MIVLGVFFALSAEFDPEPTTDPCGLCAQGVRAARSGATSRGAFGRRGRVVSEVMRVDPDVDGCQPVRTQQIQYAEQVIGQVTAPVSTVAGGTAMVVNPGR